MNQECSFYAYAVGNTTNCESFSDSGISSGNNDAFEYLDSFILAFNDLNMNSYGVSRAEFRNVISQLFILECFDNIISRFFSLCKGKCLTNDQYPVIGSACFLSFFSAFPSIWRIRSRVTPKCLPTSSRVLGVPSSMPKRRARTPFSLSVSVSSML